MVAGRSLVLFLCLGPIHAVEDTLGRSKVPLLLGAVAGSWLCSTMLVVGCCCWPVGHRPVVLLCSMCYPMFSNHWVVSTALCLTDWSNLLFVAIVFLVAFVP